MAIFHLHAQIISRKAGRSATGAAAYRAGEKIKDEVSGIIHDYTRKRGVIYSEVIMPSSSEWQPSRSELWNAVELKNKRADAQVAREFDIALPTELTDEQRRELAKSFVHEITDKYGIAADVSIHRPKEGENHHMHVLTTTNKVEGQKLGNKVRELDMIAKARGDDRGGNEIDYLRERWEIVANEALGRAGHDVRINHRTLEAQGIDREATQHEGVAVAAMERKGIRTEIRADNERIKDGNKELQAMDEEISTMEARSDELKKKILEDTQALIDIEAAERAEQEEQLKVEAAAIAERERAKLEDAREHFLKQNKPYGTFISEKTPNPVHNIIAVYGYQPVEHKDGSVFYHPRGKPSEVVFVDKKNAIKVFDKSEKTIIDMLNLSAKKWPDGFELTGSEEFRARAEGLAEKWGLGGKVKNPLLPPIGEVTKEDFTAAQSVWIEARSKLSDEIWKEVGYEKLSRAAGNILLSQYLSQEAAKKADNECPVEAEIIKRYRAQTAQLAADMEKQQAAEAAAKAQEQRIAEEVAEREAKKRLQAEMESKSKTVNPLIDDEPADSLAADEEKKPAEAKSYFEMLDTRDEIIENEQSENCRDKRHPIHGKMKRVEDIVSFFQRQPRGTPISDEALDELKNIHKLSGMKLLAAQREEDKKHRGR